VFLVGSFLILIIDSVFVFLSLSRSEKKQCWNFSVLTFSRQPNGSRE